MPTWIFPNGETVDSMSEEETPYTILRKVLKSPPGGRTTPLQFPGFNVRYKRDSSVTKKPEEGKPDAKIQHVTVDSDGADIIEGSEDEANRLSGL
jgi:hypothetical protein